MGSGRVAAILAEGKAAGPRSREAHRLDAGIGDQRAAQRIPHPEEQRKHAVRQPGFLDRCLNGAAHEFGGAGMRGMRLHDHRAARGQGRGGIPARHREGEREVAGAEDGDGAEPDHAQAQIRPGQGLALRQRRVNPHILPAAFPHLGREEAELADRAAALPLDARPWQAGFGTGAVGQRIAERVDLRGHTFQKPGALLGRRRAIWAESGIRQRAGTGNLRFRGAAIGGFQRRTGCGVKARKALAGAAQSRGADQHLSGQGHAFLL